jgi:hypothetical protein
MDRDRSAGRLAPGCGRGAPATGPAKDGGTHALRRPSGLSTRTPPRVTVLP